MISTFLSSTAQHHHHTPFFFSIFHLYSRKNFVFSEHHNHYIILLSRVHNSQIIPRFPQQQQLQQKPQKSRKTWRKVFSFIIFCKKIPIQMRIWNFMISGFVRSIKQTQFHTLADVQNGKRSNCKNSPIFYRARKVPIDSKQMFFFSVISGIDSRSGREAETVGSAAFTAKKSRDIKLKHGFLVWFGAMVFFRIFFLH
jgi:hypothetical protein